MVPAPIARYDSLARSLHWISALLIVVAFVVGLAHDLFPREVRGAIINAHGLMGVAVIILAFARLAWRLGHPAPAPVAGTAPIAALALKLGHAALYVGMIAIPLGGFAALFARGRGLNFGLFQIASPIARTPEWVKPITEAHEVAAFALIALAAGHVAAALWHHYGRGDEVLLRMMPARKA